MNKQASWNKNSLIWGIVMVALAVTVAAGGFTLPMLVTGIVFPEGFVVGVSAALAVMGMASLAQYVYVRAHPKAGQHMLNNEQDERTRQIQARAGQRAYWLSSGLAFAVLIYFEFAETVGLSPLSGNAMLFSLLVVVVLPYLAYMSGIAIEQNKQ